MMHKVNINDISLAYESTGTGPFLMLIHGFTGSSSTMSHLCEALAPYRTVLSVDLIGHGKSDSPQQIDHYTIESNIAHLQGILQHAGAKKADLVGYSLGGRIALSFANAFSNTVESLFLIGTSPGINSNEALVRKISDSDLALLIESDGLEVFVDHWMQLPIWKSLQERIGPAKWKESREQRLANTSAGLANSLRGSGVASMPPLHNFLHLITNPVHLIAGEEDPKFSQLAEQMNQLFPNGQVHIVPNAGHAAHLEQPKFVSDLIIKALK